jgi:hypothetical protein
MAPAAPGTPSDLALLALQLGNREVNRLGHSNVETPEQLECSQQLDHGGHLNRLSPLCALHRRLPDPCLGGQLSLSPIALESVARQPTAELSENGSISHKLIDMHRI